MNKPQGNGTYNMLPIKAKKESALVKEYTYDVKREVFLTKDTERLLAQVSEEWACRDILAENNLNVRNKFLFHGPSGNGKTTITRKLAEVLDLPLVEVNTAEVVDKYLGATGSNIHEIFSTVDYPCILLWDEIDSVLFKRGTGSGQATDKEMDRSVNIFLVNMEKLNPKVIFIGLTNRMDIIDVAALRRFDIKHEIPLPDKEAKRFYGSRFLQSNKINVPITEEKIEQVIEACASYAEMEIDLLNYARKYIIKSQRKTV